MAAILSDFNVFITVSAGGVVNTRQIFSSFSSAIRMDAGFEYYNVDIDFHTAVSYTVSLFDLLLPISVDGQTHSTISPSVQAFQTDSITISGSSDTLKSLSAGDQLTRSLSYTIDEWQGNFTRHIINGGSASFIFTGVNDAPVLTAAHPTLPQIDSTQTSTRTVGSIVGGGIADADHGAVSGIAITGALSSGGQWQYSVDDGASWSAFGNVSGSQALLLRSADQVRFIPGSLLPVTPTLTYRAWDQTSGTYGQVADVTASGTGGTTAFSIATDTASLDVTHANDAPVLAGVQSHTAGVSERSFALLDAGGAVSDTELDILNNYRGASLTIARHGSANPDDSFGWDISGASFSVTGLNLQTGGQTFGTYSVSAGVLRLDFTSSGTPATSALVNDVLKHVTYQNASHDPPAQVLLDYVFSDGNTGGIQGSGGPSTATGTVTVNVAAIDDLPILAGLPLGAASFTIGQGPVVLAPGAFASDVDDGNLAGAIVKIANGTFVAGDELGVGLPIANGFVDGTNIGVSYDGAGTLTLSGSDTISNYNNAIQHVQYFSTSEASSPGANKGRTISWLIDDGHPAGTSSVATSHVNVIGVTVTIGAIAIDDVINAAEAAAGPHIRGSTTNVEDGQEIALAIVGAGNQIFDRLTTLVANGVWSAGLTSAQAQALADGSYVVTADVSDQAGNAAPGATRTLSVDETAPSSVSAHVSAIDGQPSVTTGYFNANHQIDIRVLESEAVYVVGTPQLLLNDGGVASYVNGSGTDTLVFRYSTVGGQNTQDLRINSLALNNGTIRDAAGNDAVSTGLANADLGLVIDTVAPSVGIDSLASGNTITTTQAHSGIHITGTTVGVEDGQTLYVYIGSKSNGPAAGASVSAGHWSVDLTSAQLLSAPANFAIEAAVSDKAGNAASDAFLNVANQVSQSGIPFGLQAYLPLTQVIVEKGIFPDFGGNPNSDVGFPIGTVRTFAFNFTPVGTEPAVGQILPIGTTNFLPYVIGSSFGGNGSTTFAIPDLQGRASVGYGRAADGSFIFVGDQFGLADAQGSLTEAELPASRGGFSQPINDVPPSLGMSFFIRTAGAFPSQGGSGAIGSDFLGEVVEFASPYVPSGFLPADGRLLSIQGNQTLFTVLGTTYGGNGTTNFALPDLRGRDIVGGYGFESGTLLGQSTVTLSNDNLPASYGGGGQPIGFQAPGIKLEYLIATTGLFPTRRDDHPNAVLEPNASYLGEIKAFAGFYVPDGWALAAGQLLSIDDNQALFSLLGTYYGGDGRTTFALPNLIDRVVVGTGYHDDTYYLLGESSGQNILALTANNIPDDPPAITIISPTVPVEAVSSAGANVTFNAAATDLLDGTRPVTFTENLNGQVQTVAPGQVFSLGSHTLTATSSDAHGHSASESFSFSVVDTTAPAVSASATHAGVRAGIGGNAVMTFVASVTDAVDGVSDPIIFKEQLAGGVTQVVHSGDAFSIGSHTIIASATDAAHNTGSTSFGFDVTAANAAPFGVDKAQAIREDSLYIFAAADFGFNDLDGDALAQVKITTLPASGTLNLDGTAVSAGKEIIAASLPNLTYTPALNGNGTNYASFTFQVRDDGGTLNDGQDIDQSPNIFSFNVTAVNDAPSGADNTVTATEDTPYTFAAADFGFTDPADGNAFFAVKIATLPGAGTLTLNNVAVSQNDLIQVSDINLGNLKFVPASNANGAGYATFTFQVQDNGGTANSGVDLDPIANTITVDVNAVNDAPAGADITKTINEDATYTFLVADFGFTDPVEDNAFSFVKIGAITNGTLTNNNLAVNTGDIVSVTDITAGNFKFTPAANVNGAAAANVAFQVGDDGGTTGGGVNTDPSANTISFNIDPVSDAPAGTNGAVTGLENQQYTFTAANFGFTDPNDSPANAFLSVEITTVPATGTLTNNGVTVNPGEFVLVTDINAGKLKFTPTTNTFGANYATFTFQVKDDGGILNGGADLDQSANTLTINIDPVNVEPSGANKTVTTNEDIPYTFTVTDFGFSDVDGNVLAAVKVASLPLAGTLKYNGTAITPAQVTAGFEVSATDITAGKLTFDPASNANGAAYATFDFQVRDNGTTANGGVDLDQSANTITVDVNAVNDAPAGADKLVSIDEDATYTLTAADFGFTDPVEGNAFQAVKITTLPGAGTLTNNNVAVTAGAFISIADINGGLLKFAPAPDANGSGYANFTFQVQDNGGTLNSGVDLDPVANTITFDVTSVNDAPTGADKTITTFENGPYTFVAGDFGFSDTHDNPPNALSLVKITTLPGAGALTNNNVAVTAGQFISIADINGGLLKFTPTTGQTGTGYANFTFQVVDDGGGANGGADLDPTANTITVNVDPINHAPAGADKTVTTNEDTAYTFATTDFGFSDTDSNSLLAVKITTLPGAGSLTNNNVAVNAGDLVSVADITGGKLKFLPAADANGSGYASFTFQVQDNGGTGGGGIDLDQSANTITVNVTPVNDAPALNNVAANAAYTENTGPVTLSSGLVVSDVDGPPPSGNNFLGALVTIASGFVTGDQLRVFDPSLGTSQTSGNFTGINVAYAYNSATHILTLTGADTIADYQTVLQNVQFVSTSEDPTNGNANLTRTISWTITDDGSPNLASTPVTTTINVTGVDDAPVNHMPGAQNARTDTDHTIAGLSVSDVDVNSADITVTVLVQHGTIHVRDDLGAGFLGAGAITGNDTDTVTLQGSLAAVNATLAAARGVVYRSDFNYAGPDTLTLASDDGDHTGPGGPLHDIDSIGINVTARHHSITDFNPDNSDVLWERVDGTLAMWTLNGPNLAANAIAGNVGPQWQITGVADYNGDHNTDLLFRRDEGSLLMQTLVNNHVQTETVIGGAGNEWQVLGSSDFNGDTRDDILWQRTDGTLAIWDMNGPQIIATPIVGAIGPEWSLQGTGDYNGDGTGDMLWGRADGTVAMWEINNNQLQKATIVGAVGPEWQVAGSGDFNGDHKTDILWQRGDGALAIWDMNGGQVQSFSNLFTSPGAGWSLEGTADYNHDGTADLLWQQSVTGALRLDQMINNHVDPATTLGQVGTEWHLF